MQSAFIHNSLVGTMFTKNMNEKTVILKKSVIKTNYLLSERSQTEECKLCDSMYLQFYHLYAILDR